MAQLSPRRQLDRRSATAKDQAGRRAAVPRAGPAVRHRGERGPLLRQPAGPAWYSSHSLSATTCRNYWMSYCCRLMRRRRPALAPSFPPAVSRVRKQLRSHASLQEVQHGWFRQGNEALSVRLKTQTGSCMQRAAWPKMHPSQNRFYRLVSQHLPTLFCVCPATGFRIFDRLTRDGRLRWLNVPRRY